MHPEVVAGIFVFDRKGRLLLIRHHGWKSWVVAGGHVEFGETIREAARREAKEELGLDVKILGIMGIGEVILPRDFRSRKHFISAYVLCRARGNRIRRNKEVIEHAWLSPSMALSSAKDKVLRSMIRKYARERRSGRYSFVSLASDGVRG